MNGRSGADSYGEAFADVYDDWYHSVSDVAATVEALVVLAASGRVLELGVGTGRIALPLSHAGVRVDGIDASPAMLARLAAKDPDGRIHCSLGDMAHIDTCTADGPGLRGPYAVVFAAFNTFFNLDTEADQQSCIAAVARIVEPGGCLVIECFVPGPEPDDIEHHEDRRDDGAGGTVVQRSVRHPTDQTVHGVLVHHAFDGAITERPWTIRYLTPDQLDAMCETCGFDLEHRWADWRRLPFDADAATHHVSVYRRAIKRGTAADEQGSTPTIA